MKADVILSITKDMEDSLTDYQLNKLKESLIVNFEKVEFIIKTDEVKHQEELNEKQARLNEVNALLDIDNRGSNTASKGERASVIPLSSGQQKTAYADALPKRPSVLEKLHRYKDAVSSDHLTKHLSKQQSL